MKKNAIHHYPGANCKHILSSNLQTFTRHITDFLVQEVSNDSTNLLNCKEHARTISCSFTNLPLRLFTAVKITEKPAIEDNRVLLTPYADRKIRICLGWCSIQEIFIPKRRNNPSKGYLLHDLFALGFLFFVHNLNSIYLFKLRLCNAISDRKWK